MKTITEPLLDDLLEDGAPPDFREAVMDKMLCRARRRRRTRHFKEAVATAALLGIVLMSVWKVRGPAALPLTAPTPDLFLVNSHPLQPGQIVSTQSSSIEQFTSSTATLAEVQTSSSSGLYQEINDKQLLALLSEKSAILVRHGPHQAEVIFSSPDN